MQTYKHYTSSYISALRWFARILAGLLAAGLLIFGAYNAFSDKGLPNPFTEPVGIVLEMIGLAAAWIGLIVGLRRETAGGVLILAGTVLFHVVENKLVLPWAFLVLEFDGLLLLFCGVTQRRRAKKPVMPDREAMEDW